MCIKKYLGATAKEVLRGIFSTKSLYEKKKEVFQISGLSFLLKKL
jgi:hypothetical protein